jgi:hypothetical protein
MQLWRSLCTNVAEEAWCDARTGLRRPYDGAAVMRCAGSTGSAVGVSNRRLRPIDL